MTFPYRLSTRFVVVKTVLENICKSSTSLVIVKTDLFNFCRPSTGFGVGEQWRSDYHIACLRTVEVHQSSFKYCKVCWLLVADRETHFNHHEACWTPEEDRHTCFDYLLKACRYSARQFWLLQTLLNIGADLLQAFNGIGGSQIMYDDPPQTFNWFGVGMTFLYSLSTSFPVVKMCLRII